MTRIALVAASVALLTVGAVAQDHGWRSAEPGRMVTLPADHASHPDYKIEWWYYTGNLRSADGRRFGYQVTFFRVGIDATPVNPSRWAVRDLFMTHVAVSALSGGSDGYRFEERLNRGGPGIAGAETTRYHVWNEDWTAGLDAEGRHVLRAWGADGVDLVLDPGKPPAIKLADRRICVSLAASRGKLLLVRF